MARCRGDPLVEVSVDGTGQVMSTGSGQPGFDGQCAFAVSTGKLGVDGSLRHRLDQDGRTYLFKNGAAKLLWRLLPGRAARADEVWAARGS